MKCPFLRFESDCVGAECPLYVSAEEIERRTQSTAPRPECGLRLLTGFFFAYRRDCAKILREMENLGKRISRKIDEHESHMQRRF